MRRARTKSPSAAPRAKAAPLASAGKAATNGLHSSASSPPVSPAPSASAKESREAPAAERAARRRSRWSPLALISTVLALYAILELKALSVGTGWPSLASLVTHRYLFSGEAEWEDYSPFVARHEAKTLGFAAIGYGEWWRDELREEYDLDAPQGASSWLEYLLDPSSECRVKDGEEDDEEASPVAAYARGKAVECRALAHAHPGAARLVRETKKPKLHVSRVLLVPGSSRGAYLEPIVNKTAKAVVLFQLDGAQRCRVVAHEGEQVVFDALLRRGGSLRVAVGHSLLCGPDRSNSPSFSILLERVAHASKGELLKACARRLFHLLSLSDARAPRGLFDRRNRVFGPSEECRNGTTKESLGLFFERIVLPSADLITSGGAVNYFSMSVDDEDPLRQLTTEIVPRFAPLLDAVKRSGSNDNERECVRRAAVSALTGGGESEESVLPWWGSIVDASLDKLVGEVERKTVERLVQKSTTTSSSGRSRSSRGGSSKEACLRRKSEIASAASRELEERGDVADELLMSIHRLVAHSEC